MPYIITTKPRCPNCRAGDGEGECLCADAASRRAVATLKEARFHAAESAVALEADTAHAEQARALTEAGGTIGPLPDGTVIEVARVLIENLIVSGGLKTQYVTAARHADTAMSDADVIDAYNARQGVHA